MPLQFTVDWMVYLVLLAYMQHLLFPRNFRSTSWASCKHYKWSKLFFVMLQTVNIIMIKKGKEHNGSSCKLLILMYSWYLVVFSGYLYLYSCQSKNMCHPRMCSMKLF
jgi:hypothetical protein